MGLFGKDEKDPKEQVNEWCRQIRKENNALDRQIRGIMREEEKVKRSLKDAAKKNDKDTCRILAKELVRSRKAVGKLHGSKAHLNSVQMQMRNQLSVSKVAGSLQKSTAVMQAMSALVKVPEIADTMRAMSKEMMKVGIMEEMLEETMDSAIDDSEDMDEDIQTEVDKVLWEVTAGTLGKAPATVTETPGANISNRASTSEEATEDEESLELMQSRLQALRS